MSKTRIEPVIIITPDPNRELPPIDTAVQPPNQARHDATRANELITGLPAQSTPQRDTARSQTKSYSDAEMDEALQKWDRGELKVTDPNFEKIIELAREAVRLKKAHRRGARQTRQKSDSVTRRLEALVQAYRELSPKRQANPTGQQTLDQLRKSIIKKLDLRDEDDVISEDTIKQDIRQVRPILRAVQQGIIPRTGRPNRKGLSEKTRQEMGAGKRALAKANAPRRRRQHADRGRT